MPKVGPLGRASMFKLKNVEGKIELVCVVLGILISSRGSLKLLFVGRRSLEWAHVLVEGGMPLAIGDM